MEREGGKEGGREGGREGVQASRQAGQGGEGGRQPVKHPPSWPWRLTDKQAEKTHGRVLCWPKFLLYSQHYIAQQLLSGSAYAHCLSLSVSVSVSVSVVLSCRTADRVGEDRRSSVWGLLCGVSHAAGVLWWWWWCCGGKALGCTVKYRELAQQMYCCSIKHQPHT